MVNIYHGTPGKQLDQLVFVDDFQWVTWPWHAHFSCCFATFFLSWACLNAGIHKYENQNFCLKDSMMLFQVSILLQALVLDDDRWVTNVPGAMMVFDHSGLLLVEPIAKQPDYRGCGWYIPHCWLLLVLTISNQLFIDVYSYIKPG